MSLHSEQINELMAALAKAQGEMSHASKDSANPHFKTRYADLASVWQACKEPLAKNGLSVAQPLAMEGDKQVIITLLGHSSGQWIKSIIPLPIQKPGAQEMGSCISYCRRYALASMVGVYQDDDDGEAAQQPYRQEPRKDYPQPAAMAPKGLSDKQIELLQGKIKKHPDLENWILKKYSVPKVTDISWSQLSEVLEKVNNKEAKEGVVSEPKSGQ